MRDILTELYFETHAYFQFLIQHRFRKLFYDLISPNSICSEAKWYGALQCPVLYWLQPWCPANNGAQMGPRTNKMSWLGRDWFIVLLILLPLQNKQSEGKANLLDCQRNLQPVWHVYTLGSLKMEQGNETIRCVPPDRADYFIARRTTLSLLDSLSWRNIWPKRDSRVR